MATPPDSQPRRSSAGLLSSASSFFLPVGPRITPGKLGGYYIDMRIKAATPDWPPSELTPLDQQLFVDVIQWGLGCYEHFLADGGRDWLESALAVGRHLVSTQQTGGAREGGWIHQRPYHHTFPTGPSWLSSMAQGEGASLLVRLHAETGEQQFADAALRALGPLSLPVAQGGVQGDLAGREFPQEYPTDPDSHVLNGAIFTLWGCYDVGIALGDAAATHTFETGIETLAASLDRWDTGYWSRYDLFPHPVLNVASSFYHDLHIRQLRALNLIAPAPQFEAAAGRFDSYRRSRLNRGRAFGRKVLFRLLVPRNRLLAKRASKLWRRA